MKKNLIASATIIALAFAATSCSDPVKTQLANSTDADGEQYGKEVITMGNDVAEVMGTFQGANDRKALEQNYLPTLRAELDDYHAKHFDQKAFLEGMRAALSADTTDFSYRYGYQQGLMMRQNIDGMAKAYDMPVPTSTFYKAYVKALTDSTVDNRMEELQQQAGELDMELQARKQEVDQKRIEKARKANTEAAEAKKKELLEEGYKELPSGIIYKVNKQGAGRKVNRDDVVIMNYTGKHLNGKEFDSTEGNPIQSAVRSFVPGYQEALQLLAKGGKVTVYIPGELAYGEMGQPRAGIGPNEMLMFEIEVVDIAPVEPEEADATNAVAGIPEEVLKAAAMSGQSF